MCFLKKITNIIFIVNREKWKNITAQKSSSNIIVLRERIVSLQQQNSVLQNAKKTAELSVKEYKEINEKLLQQQQVSDQRYQISRQTIKVKKLKINYNCLYYKGGYFVLHVLFCSYLCFLLWYNLDFKNRLHKCI